MRRIFKSGDVPVSLQGLVPPESASDIDSDLYNGADVKERLIRDHHSKCVYCECRLNGDYGHIEHFRPKGGYSIPPDRKLHKPGYYWLAYAWENLLLSCSKCNTSYKANHFALADESVRDIPNRNIAGEMPMLINPSIEDPALYIEFHEHMAASKIVDGEESPRGKYTIDLLQLNHRTDLVKNRRDVWEKFNRWEKVRIVAMALIDRETDVARGKELLAIADLEMANMADNAAEYSAMFL